MPEALLSAENAATHQAQIRWQLRIKFWTRKNLFGLETLPKTTCARMPFCISPFFGICESVLPTSVSEGPLPWHWWLVEVSSPPNRIHEPACVGICFRSRLSESDYGHEGKTRNIYFCTKQIGFGKNVHDISLPIYKFTWCVSRWRTASWKISSCHSTSRIQGQAFHVVETEIRRPSRRTLPRYGHDTATSRAIRLTNRNCEERSIRHWWTRPIFCTSPTSIATGSKKGNLNG